MRSRVVENFNDFDNFISWYVAFRSIYKQYSLDLKIFNDKLGSVFYYNICVVGYFIQEEKEVSCESKI